MRRVSFALLIAACVSGLAGCGQAPAEKWDADPVLSKRVLVFGDTVVDGVKIRQPLNYLKVEDGPRMNVQAYWIGGGEPPVWFVPSNGLAQSVHWQDSQQVMRVQGTCPIAPGETQMVQCETEAVPRDFRIYVRKNSGNYPASDANLAALATHDIETMKGPEVKDLQIGPVEYGIINGVRFARAKWTAEIPVPKYMPMVKMNVPAPAAGFNYAAISGGKIIEVQAKAPKGDGALSVMEQSVLSVVAPTDS